VLVGGSFDEPLVMAVLLFVCWLCSIAGSTVHIVLLQLHAVAQGQWLL
jgi:hypothetical protein